MQVVTWLLITWWFVISSTVVGMKTASSVSEMRKYKQGNVSVLRQKDSQALTSIANFSAKRERYSDFLDVLLLFGKPVLFNSVTTCLLFG